MSTTIAKDQVVTFHYTLKDQQGQVIDQSVGGDPLAYLHGHGNIIPGLESQLLDKKVGDRLQVHVTPENGYGVHDPEKRFLIPRNALPKVELQPGMMLELEAEDGETLRATIVALDAKHVEVDANHSLAGVDLFFDVEIVAIRPASAEEIAHGHVHGEGGHHH